MLNCAPGKGLAGGEYKEDNADHSCVVFLTLKHSLGGAVIKYYIIYHIWEIMLLKYGEEEMW